MKYDLVMVMDPVQEAKITLEKMAALIEKEGFSILESSSWGKKILAYPLKKRSEGVYLQFTIASDTAKPKSLYTKFRLENTVLRSLVLKKEDDKKLKTQILRPNKKNLS